MPFLNDAADALEFPPPPPEVLNGNGRGETLTGLEEHRPEGPFGLSDYEAVIGRERVDELKRLAEPLTGRGWVDVNSTAVGGGVAEMLRSVVPLDEIFGAYLDTIDENACETFIASDLTVIHDPQPAAMIMNAPIRGNVKLPVAGTAQALSDPHEALFPSKPGRASVQVRQWGPRESRLLARDEGLNHVPAEPPAAAIFSLQFVQTLLSYWKF